ncbi:MAG: nitrogen fixation protein NifA [Halobacteriovoraceae bacterium]|nr:nitrogen fixation protein NifA [Halobacteriovoraceae bacterium]|tara:strand:+ start:436 stop:2001 length:1566 start_codon:yes stop_codon:yes gene_type:complete
MAIDWTELGSLHVISKVKELIQVWFGAEIFFTDLSGQVKSSNWNKDYHYKNQFLAVLNQTGHGMNTLGSEFERFFDEDIESGKFDSSIPGVSLIGEHIKIDGESVGGVFAFPVVENELNDSQIDLLRKTLESLGVKGNSINICINSLAGDSKDKNNYLKELVALITNEIITYHHEIKRREDLIGDLNSELGDRYRYHSMIGKSKQMQKIYRLLEKISSSESSVFILGENGTGKELVAKAIHYYSPRRDKIFLALNCSAFNDNLLDSELFGHVKGAFTGALKDKRGLFEQADGGTLFLDEIGDTSLSMQVKLLRVLQEGTFMPVGGTSPKKCNVRILAATNKDVKKMMAEGEFREDLFYRINVINVDLPPLRDRSEDIPVLIDHFLDKKCQESGVNDKTIAKKTLEKMLDYNWPGNVRELENEVERLFVLSGDEKMIHQDSLSQRILDHVAASAPVSSNLASRSGNLKEATEDLERVMIKEGLRRCNFNKSKLAKELGVSRASLIMKVEKYGLDKRKKAAGE